jgi:hypothetical protein
VNKIDKLTKKYYSIASASSLEKLRAQLFYEDLSLNERKKLYKKKEKIFAPLEEVFKELVHVRNEIAKVKGHDNYFDFIAQWDGIPKKDLEQFFLKSKKQAKQIISQLPNTNLPDWFWSEYNAPNPILLFETLSYSLPNDVFNALEIKQSELEKIQKRVKFKQKRQRYNWATPNAKEKTVEILHSKNDQSALGAINLAHEIGHARAFLKLMDKNIDPESKKDYWHETQAINSEFAFEKTLPENERNIVRERFLGHFILTFFEHSIYKNPNQDFKKVFAKANRLYYPTKQKENPFFLLNTFLVNNPCYSTIYSVLYSKLLV